MRCPRVLASALLSLAMAWTPIQGGEPPDRQWRFSVLLDGKPVGHHHVDLAMRGSELEYRSETRLAVKILFLTAYRYLHVDREVWREDCLTQIDSTTDDDGKAQFLKGSQTGGTFALSTDRGARELSAGCVMTFAYWNPRILSATRLMNAQTGEYIAVRSNALGRDRIQVRGTPVDAERFAIVGDKLNIELWYAAGAAGVGEWLALATTTERGGRLEYRLLR